MKQAPLAVKERSCPAAGTSAPTLWGQCGSQGYSSHTPFTFSPNGHQFHAFAGYVIQGFVDVSNFVESHFSAVRFGQPFPCQMKKKNSIGTEKLTPWRGTKMPKLRVHASLSGNRCLTISDGSLASVNHRTEEHGPKKLSRPWTDVEPYAFQIRWETPVWPTYEPTYKGEQGKAGWDPRSLWSCWLAVRGSQDGLVQMTAVAARAHLRHLIMKIYGSGQTCHHPPSHTSSWEIPSLIQSLTQPTEIQGKT